MAKGKKGNPGPPAASKLRSRLLSWYRTHGRDLPWRGTQEPYSVWVSEVMLQQTRVETVIPYYESFMRRFPALKDLADASFEDVLKAWENLGYYSRARHLHEAARIVVRDLGGRMPRNRGEMIKLPGVGAYTAGAILSIAYGERVPAVDGNVRRVLSRIYALREPLADPAMIARLEQTAARLVPKRDPGRFNQALMDLGATVCTPRRPVCADCPVRHQCRAFESGLQQEIPVKVRRRSSPIRQMTAALIRDRSDRLLLVRRPDRGLLAGLWGLPGGEVLRGEAPQSAVLRSVLGSLDLRLKILRPMGLIEHAYTHFRIVLHAFECAPKSPRSSDPDGGKWRWATRPEIETLALARVDRKVLQLLSDHPLHPRLRRR